MKRSKLPDGWPDRFVVGVGRPWMGELAGLLTLDGKPKKLKRMWIMDRRHYWARPQYRLVFERVKEGKNG